MYSLLKFFFEFTAYFVLNIQLEELQNVPEKSKQELEKLEEKKNDLEVLSYYIFNNLGAKHTASNNLRIHVYFMVMLWSCYC